MPIDDLIKQVREYNPDADVGFIQDAYEFAKEAHKGQQRRSGQEYIVHPVEAAKILADLHMDVITIVTGLLHDVVEDTDVPLSKICEAFGEDVAQLVDGVTKLSRIEFKSKEEQQVENLRKMFLAMAKDIRVIIIKLADRLHNMRTLRHQSPEKQREIAEETLEIFAPLAHRLGIFRIKWELEDLALRYMHPQKYYQLVQSISMKRQEREQYINEVIAILKAKLDEVGIKSDIQGRPKHFYSIYNKMEKQQKHINEIYDLIAVRLVVDSVKDCYGALGIIHTLWKPIPMRFKDYIAMPKPNMYQSLHTTVLGPRGEPFEIQIRTWDMHKTAEFGIAAHWEYKEGHVGDQKFNEKLIWLRQLLDWQRDQKDASEFMESLKVDFFSDRVYVFTPAGDVVELPAGSVPIDFAYRIHSDVGHQCVGAKVNGKIVPLDYQLKTGDIVEVLTYKSSGPSRDWLNLVQTSQAKNRIRQWFRKEQREENIIKGREILEKECKKLGLPMGDTLKTNNLLEAAKRYNIMSVDDLYVAFAEGAISAIQVLHWIKDNFKIKIKKDTKEETQPGPEKPLKPFSGYGKPSSGVRVKGIDNLLVRLSRCCNPLPGDKIIGYITKGRGVSIHRTDCPNVADSLNGKERLIDVVWDTAADAVYQVEIEVSGMDRPGFALDVMNAISDSKTNVNAINARTTKNKLAIVDMKVEIHNIGHLKVILDKLKKVKDVMEVKRLTPS
ncbi:RelA/SpoT family protein [Desulfitibacter alkalitolerans]|uniref:RelA/SpoT family protein n=1 Tax=Desulfitibacter alkalitolerans TaxID=264641 RepID=UPI0004802E5B|nr:bifunctional (p)ppGpp synthetase/guanosine-3',5'-bis(diphosphate) 3'-pyrophosphohydrolase [Desulfitibacter alkalitolerans]